MSSDTTTASPWATRWESSPDWIALGGVLVTVVLSFLTRTVGATGFFIVGAVIFWATYVCWRSRNDPKALHNWGFRADNLAEAAAVALLVFLVITAIFGIFGLAHKTVHFPAHLLAQLLIYPAWGIIQQFLALAIVVGNLERTAFFQTRTLALVVVTALLFSVVHLYDPWVAVGAFVLELVLVPMYFRYRNLWPLGILHGWCGALYYLWVLDQDLWNEIVAGARGIVGV